MTKPERKPNSTNCKMNSSIWPSFHSRRYCNPIQLEHLSRFCITKTSPTRRVDAHGHHLECSITVHLRGNSTLVYQSCVRFSSLCKNIIYLQLSDFWNQQAVRKQINSNRRSMSDLTILAPQFAQLDFSFLELLAPNRNLKSYSEIASFNSAGHLWNPPLESI